MNWNPNDRQKKFLETIIVMSTDCIMGKGTANIETYLSNLRIMADMIEKKEIEV